MFRVQTQECDSSLSECGMTELGFKAELEGQLFSACPVILFGMCFISYIC